MNIERKEEMREGEEYAVAKGVRNRVRMKPE